MKKRLIILLIIGMGLITAGLGANYLLSMHKVAFTLESTTDSISVYSEKDQELQRFSENDHILLQEGKYYYIPEGENIVEDKIAFTVGEEDIQLSVNPPFTREVLAVKLKEEQSAIESALSGKYPAIFIDYTLSQGALYNQGEWFGALLKPKVSDIRDQRDPYRVVLKKVNNKWEVVRRPEYVLTAPRYKEVPINILREINSIVGEPGN